MYLSNISDGLLNCSEVGPTPKRHHGLRKDGIKLSMALRKHAHMILYTNFFRSKIDNFQGNIFDIFSHFCSKHRLYVAETVLTSTHNLCFGAEIRKIGIPCIHQFYDIIIKVGFKGAFIERTC